MKLRKTRASLTEKLQELRLFASRVMSSTEIESTRLKMDQPTSTPNHANRSLSTKTQSLAPSVLKLHVSLQLFAQNEKEWRSRAMGIVWSEEVHI